MVVYYESNMINVGNLIINLKILMKVSCTKVVGMNGPNSGSGIVVVQEVEVVEVVEVVPW